MEPKKRILTPEQDALEHISTFKDKPFLEEKYIDSIKGRGVFTNKAIPPSTFVVEYRGIYISYKDTKPRKKSGNYLFEFKWKGVLWRVDASMEDGTLGRLVNDNHISPNCKLKIIPCEGKPHLCLFSLREISPGEEITYSYGGTSYPWRQKKSCDRPSTSRASHYATTSRKRKKRFEDSEETSSFENSDSDGEEESSDSENVSSGDINSQQDFRDGSPTTIHSSEEMAGTITPLDETSSNQQEDEAASRSNEVSLDKECRPRKAKEKHKNPSCTNKNFCYVCGKGCCKIARHLLRHIDEEPEIAEAFALPQNSKERKKLLDKLRNRGNYKHNQEVLKNNSGELKLRRRPKNSVASAKTHVHCPHCKGMYVRKEMWRHVARCSAGNSSNSPKDGRTRVLGEILLAESPFSQKIPSGVRKMLLNMKQDEIAFTIQNDLLLIQLAQYLSERSEYSQNKNDYIRQKLRQMGRLLMVLHKKSVSSFEDAIKPQHFSKVVEAVKDLAGFDKKRKYIKPSFASKLGCTLKQIGDTVLTGVDSNEQKMRDAKNFVKLCAKEWSDLVSQTAADSSGRRRVKNPSTIPFTHDVQVFYMYLEETSASAITSLKKYESPELYSGLCRVTLAQVSVLNKCAPEVSKMTVKAFQERNDSTQVLSKNFIRINILSSTGENVAVLFTSELVRALTLLVSKRKACGVHRHNPFLFARPNCSTGFYHGRNCIEDFSSLCHAKNPEHLRSVHLHKHIARVFQILNLENDELRHLAKLLGHDIRTDRDYYRTPEAAVELAKIAKLLLAMEKGSLQKFEGNSLEEIEIEDELEPDVEQGNLETNDAEKDSEESDQQEHVVEQQAVTQKQRRQLTAEQDALEHMKSCTDKPFLEEKFIDPFKGRGVFTRDSIEPSSFVVEYRGKISPKETARKKCGDTLNHYLFDFSWNGSNWRIDASEEDGTLGRLVNDDHINPNCELKKIVHEGKPHLCLFAMKKISPDEEITYNYGDAPYPWRATKSNAELDKSQMDPQAAASSFVDESAEDSAGAFSSAESGSDDEYIPDGEASSDGSYAGDNEQSHNFKDNLDPDSSTQQSVQQEDRTDGWCNNSAPDEEPKRHRSPSRNYCYICGKAQAKISRHLFTHRKEEPDIAKVFALPRNSRLRYRLLDKLRNRGNYKHNQEVLKTKCGDLKVSRRTRDVSTDAKTFALCLYCKRMYARKDMWRHFQRCSSKKSLRTQGMIKVLTLVAHGEVSGSKEISSCVSQILKNLKKDEIASAVKNDPHILYLAEYWSHLNKKEKKRESVIHRLRLMGRLLLTLRKKSISSFEDAMKPENFSVLVEAVRELAAFNEEKKTCDRPSILMRLGGLLKKLSEINYAIALKEDADKQTMKEKVAFMKLCKKEWVYVPLAKSKINNLPTIPFIHDVQLFYQYMETTAASAVESLTLYESPQVYHALISVTAAQVSVLNKHMPDASRVTLKSFNERDKTELQEDAAVHQSQFDQVFSKHFVKINVMNNKGEPVVITLTPKLLTAITLLISKRDACGVHRTNPFLFARPIDVCMSCLYGQQCAGIFIARCGASNAAGLRSAFFRKHIARFFRILSLTNDELELLAKLLGRDIRTDSDYYLMPEAAGDIAKISELLSAIENGSLDRFEGLPLEEIQCPDELEPDVELVKASNVESNVEPENMEKSDTEEENEESDSSLLLSGLSPLDVSISKATKNSRYFGGRVRRRKKKQVSESELSDENNDDVNPEKDDRSEEIPVSCDVNTPEKTSLPSNEDATKMSFSDDDEDMHVDFDINTDEENSGDGDTNRSAAIPWIPDVRDMTKQDKDNSDTKNADSSPHKDTTAADFEETMDMDPVSDAEEDDQKIEEEQSDWVDADSRSCSPILNTEKKSKLSAAIPNMKEVKIIIPKLDIEKWQASVNMSKLSSVSNCEGQKKDQPIHENNKCPTSSVSTESNKPSDAKSIQMSCSHCKKSMMKGQTAYQKKGFTDVFCSKDCLFQMFPINKPAAKTCYYCHKAISQPLDLIMAAVDIKGTIKDFCSVTCLSSFKSNSGSTQTLQATCSTCNKSCTTTCELTLYETVHKFCSVPCLDDFHRNNTHICDNCSSTCLKKLLMLELEKETKTICSEKCLDDFKEKIKTPHQCTMCHTSLQMSNMVHHKSDVGIVELFCNRHCVTSYTLQCEIVDKLQEKKSSALSRNIERCKQLKKKVNTEDVNTSGNDASAPADLDTTPQIANECFACGKKLQKDHQLYRPSSSSEVFCSDACFFKEHPEIKSVPRKCYNCFQVILRPHNIILAPVDDSGTMRDLCSNACLSSVNSKLSMAPSKPRWECRICSRFCFCKYSLNQNGTVLRLCSDECFIKYHKDNNLPVFTCDVCISVCHEKHLVLKREDGLKNICSDECLVKFKEKVKSRQLCPTCQTSHQMCDMVENKNEEGRLDFYCSNRCIMVHKAQSFPVSKKNEETFDDDDIKEVKPSLLNLDFIKEEPTDEEYNQDFFSIFKEEFKDEPIVTKEDLKIDSVFSVKRESESAALAPEPTQTDLKASCSDCKKVLMDGETVYQRKSRADIFCSTSCLLNFYQVKQTKKCHFCLQVLTQTQDVLQAPVDAEQTMKDFCSQSCISSFNYKRIVSTKIPITPVASQSQCSMCTRYCISKHEVIQQDVVQKICSDSCFLRFCNMNKLSVCENCRSSSKTPIMLRMRGGSKSLCSAECLDQFKQRSNTLEPCALCSTPHLMLHMVENNSEDAVELFCTSSCVMASKIQAVSASGTEFICDQCGKTIVPACHLAMSDSSIRNFCTLTCAMAFKEALAPSQPQAASDQTQCDFSEPPKKLPCAQCQRILKFSPKVVLKKGKMNFVCSLACSQEFRRVNNIMGNCEYCKNKRIISDDKRVDGKDCYFCSDGCKTLFCHDLEEKWGEHCHSCAYCFSISKTLVSAKYKGTKKEFCSEDCNSKYKMLFCHLAKCDTCGREGKLRQKLAMLRDVKHFCDLKCLLHFCNQKLQTGTAVASPPASAGTAESSPVITSVISLAEALARQNSESSIPAQPVFVPDIQTKVVGHASVQTISKELKNKSMLCTPLVHNKGVSCTTQTVDTEVQTDIFFPKEKALPVPVPVYVPVPMNMYSQYTPKPVVLPVPVPVPVFLTVTPNSSDATMKSVDMIQTNSSEGERDLKSEMEKTQETEDRQKDNKGHDINAPKAPPASPAPPAAALEMRESPQSSLSLPPAPSSVPHTERKVHKNEGCQLQQIFKTAKKEKSKRDFSKAMSRKRHKLKSQRGIDAWRRWIQWRKSQTNMGLIPPRAVTSNKDILDCSASELSEGLCCFITEVKRPDGEPYSPDSLFYLCLSIQQYLFENGHMENIFSDPIYNKFSVMFTKILKGFKPSETSSGYVASRVEEEFLWDCKQLGAFSPIVLLTTFLFFFCKYFGFTTLKQHRELSFAHVMCCTKTNQENRETTFLRFYPATSINEAESDADGVPAKKRKTNEKNENFLEMKENTMNPLRCPVRLYKFYLSKCPESVRQRTDLFYLQPDRSCVPSSSLWFSSTPLDVSTMEAMLVRILAVRDCRRKVEESWTSRRQTTIFMPDEEDSE